MFQHFMIQPYLTIKTIHLVQVR